MKDFDETEQQIFGLIEAADTNQAALAEAIQALQAEREALRQALRAALADEMRQSLAGVNRTAAEAERRLKGAVAWFSWRWAALAAAATGGLLLAVWLGTFAAVQWEMSDLQYLRGEIARQQATLNTLTKKGGRTVLSTCGNSGPPGRLCVQIDKTAGEFGDGYFVIQGY